FMLENCSGSDPLLEPNENELTQEAPETYMIKFITSQGEFLLKVNREYSPLGVDRFYYLTKNNYFAEARFFRVVKGFVAQFGISGNPEINKVWEDMGIPDEPVKYTNKRGSISYARSGPNTRSIQLFFNLVDNTRLDKTDWGGVVGFPPLGEIVEGVEVLDKLYDGYGEEPDQDSINAKGNTYLMKKFPKLDYIISTEIVE
ncbi:MAG: peptidylprolyl isomerase, partial [Ignavibacteriales bacterium]|nr:peptidylprolyl isomerase [Ignavibacteriales bacterium]